MERRAPSPVQAEAARKASHYDSTISSLPSTAVCPMSESGKEIKSTFATTCNTNTIESAFSLLKRGLTEAFHKVSLEHLQRYLNEFSFGSTIVKRLICSG